MIVDKIQKYLTENDLILDEQIRYNVEKLAGWTFKRQFMDNSERELKGKLYISAAGKCARQLAYGFHGFEKAGKEMDARSKLIFWMGDLVELTVVNLAKLAGVQILASGFDQMTVTMDIDGFKVNGHPDGIVWDNGRPILFECKSMSSFRFEDFERGCLTEDYLYQINCYMFCLGIDKAVVVGVNKDSGVLYENVYVRDDKIVQDAQINMKRVLDSTHDNLPEPKYEANAKKEYPWQCLYCSYWCHCKPNAEKVLVKNSYKLVEK
jgi:hypothetical protein